MLYTNIPSKFAIPFANGAGTSYINPIPEASQIGITNGAASLTDGFPPLTFLQASAGGAGPFGKDFNGILNQITAWNRWQAAGGTVEYDSAFSTAIGGYPKRSILASTTTGVLWLNFADGNATDPDSVSAANWGKILTQDLNGRVGINTLTPTVSLQIIGTDAIQIPSGSIAARPATPSAGAIRFNSDYGTYEGYTGTAWGSLGGGATGGGNDRIFFLNGQTITQPFTVPAGENAGSFGPLAIAAGVTVTVSSGATWSIV